MPSDPLTPSETVRIHVSGGETPCTLSSSLEERHPACRPPHGLVCIPSQQHLGLPAHMTQQCNGDPSISSISLDCSRWTFQFGRDMATWKTHVIKDLTSETQDCSSTCHCLCFTRPTTPWLLSLLDLRGHIPIAPGPPLSEVQWCSGEQKSR